MTRIYFAAGGDMSRDNITFGRWDWLQSPLNILVAYPFIKGWQSRTFETPGVRTMLDSGAYSAWNSGVVIDLDALCQEANNEYWNEVVALDVIGDPLASLRNALDMKNGVG